MAIFLDENTKVIVQGMTGSEGTKHTRRMIASGTKIVGGVTPGKGGQVVEIEGKSSSKNQRWPHHCLRWKSYFG